MADVGEPQTCGRVEIAVAVGVEDVGAIAARDHELAVALDRAHVRKGMPEIAHAA